MLQRQDVTRKCLYHEGQEPREGSRSLNMRLQVQVILSIKKKKKPQRIIKYFHGPNLQRRQI